MEAKEAQQLVEAEISVEVKVSTQEKEMNQIE
jgi:hypothetical protein